MCGPLPWSGNPAHLRLEDYLVVRTPGGEPVAKMRVDYTSEDGTRVFSQLTTMDRLQGFGIAAMLIEIWCERGGRCSGW